MTVRELALREHKHIVEFHDIAIGYRGMCGIDDNGIPVPLRYGFTEWRRAKDFDAQVLKWEVNDKYPNILIVTYFWDGDV